MGFYRFRLFCTDTIIKSSKAQIVGFSFDNWVIVYILCSVDKELMDNDDSFQSIIQSSWVIKSVGLTNLGYFEAIMSFW